MTDPEEKAFEAGERAANLRILQIICGNLGHESTEASHARWILERAAAIQALRDFCEAGGGDNDWPDELHLGDIINKHLEWPEPEEPKPEPELGPGNFSGYCEMIYCQMRTRNPLDPNEYSWEEISRQAKTERSAIKSPINPPGRCIGR